ncbi:hypothetical protein [Gordonia sp. (in: high G+C Gram-positive bacteria)]|uniref:hypothetical protein n=1 Tax=Gordonia sp. (in: high G+C Gram-positive bacteria) TaxID=84139 RepID=UPI003F9856D4
MRIRSDLVGVVHIGGVVLAAGDTVPDGVTVGDHLVAEKVKEADSGSTGRTRRRGSTSRATSDD